MPTLLDVLAKFSFLTTTPAIVGLIITAGLIVVISDWRFSLAALSVQYVLVGLLLTWLIQPQVAVIKVLIGALVCVILYLTARLVSESSEAPPLEREDARGETSLPDFAFRLLAALFVGLAVYSLSMRYPLPEVSLDIGFVCYWLASVGLLALVMTEEPLKTGMGLLTLITGFELFFSVLERSLSVVGFLGIANFLIALAIAYLAPSTALRHSSGRGPSTGSGRGPSTGSGRGPSTGSGRGPSTGSGRGAASGAELTPGEGER